jgi:rhodanese-related sulfurtransferase
MAAPNEITVNQLLRLIGTPECPVIIDVCIDDDFSADPHLIPGSIRHPHTDLSGMIEKIGSRSAVISCQKGLKLSQGVVAWLRSEGVTAEYLQGGMFGWKDNQNAPRIPYKSVPFNNDQETLWVTRHRPKIDRVACPWLIRRFIDAKARFLFVAPSEVRNVADRFNAIPFDIEDVFWSHRGDLCTFDTMLDEFGLRTEPLDRLSKVIRGADTTRHDLTAEAAGLLALSVGLSRQFKDDQAQLNAAMPIYDALYRWARDGQGEGHSWPNGSKA